MTREEIVAKAAADAGISKEKAGKALSSVLKSITKALSKGDKVTFVGFGTFSVAKRAARTGRNPQTGAKLNIPASKVPKFKAGKKLKAAV
jgi:DNA-binding protein HU-beta